MTPIHRPAAFLTLLVALAGCAVPAFDHYSPTALRAAAQEREGAGDAETARVLRARADRLEPQAPRTAVAAPAPPPAATPIPPPPAPPALWPAK